MHQNRLIVSYDMCTQQNHCFRLNIIKQRLKKQNKKTKTTLTHFYHSSHPTPLLPSYRLGYVDCKLTSSISTLVTLSTSSYLNTSLGTSPLSPHSPHPSPGYKLEYVDVCLIYFYMSNPLYFIIFEYLCQHSTISTHLTHPTLPLVTSLSMLMYASSTSTWVTLSTLSYLNTSVSSPPSALTSPTPPFPWLPSLGMLILSLSHLPLHEWPSLLHHIWVPHSVHHSHPGLYIVPTHRPEAGNFWFGPVTFQTYKPVWQVLLSAITVIQFADSIVSLH